MIKKVKSYLVFTSLAYRIVMYLVMPVILAGACVLGKRLMGGGILLEAAWFLTLAEVVADHWLFGGIQAKDSDKIDFLKTSSRGMGLMRDALAVDLLRKLLYGAVILTVCYLAVVPPQEREAVGGLGMHMYLLMLFYAAVVLAILLSRYCGNFWMNLMIGHAAGLLDIFGCFLPGLPEYAAVYAVLFGALGISVSILAVKTAMKKVEGSYYDQ